MHLLISHASDLSPACAQTLSHLELPRLARLLGRLAAGPVDRGDEYSLSPPHERALARALGLAGADGTIPWAARHAAHDGIETLDLAWGELTPVHWRVGAEQVMLSDPLQLELRAEESRAFFDAVHPLFDSEGHVLTWGAPLRWYLAHESLSELPTASIDRVIGRGVDRWLPDDPQARLLRRLQNEVQMLLYTHPLNEAREARGALTVNSFWLSGCGRQQAATEPDGLQVDDSLRAPLLAGDWVGWAQAWQALDEGPVAQALARVERGQALTLTLCGERHAQPYASQARGLWQRLRHGWQAPDPARVLQVL